MKLLSIGLILLLSFCDSIYTQTKNWKIVDTRPDYSTKETFSFYKQLRCADSLNCIVLGEKNGYGGTYIRSTTDGGNTWKYIYMDTSYHNSNEDKYGAIYLHEIQYPNPNLIIAIGDSGLIVRSTNKGDTWEKYYIGKNKQLFKLRMLDEKYGIMGCATIPYDSTSFLFETTDGGITWKKMEMPPGLYRFGIKEIDLINRFLFVCTNLIRNKDSKLENSVLWVHDSWKSFDSIECPPNLNMDFIDEDYGWVSSTSRILDSAGWTVNSQIIFNTEDGGRTWSKQRDTVFDAHGIYDLKFFDKNFGMITGFEGLMLVTTNGGKKWKEEYVKDDIHKGLFFMMQSVQVPSITTAYVIGEGDYVFKYTRDWTDVVEEKIDTDFEVSPNPAKDFIDISVGANGRSPLQSDVKIYNVLGEIQTTPSLRDTPPWKGGEIVKIDVSGFAPGMYFVQIGDKVSKFVKL
jgi:photosystem II stability/assembly factor-like uncharacterized protein